MVCILAKEPAKRYNPSIYMSDQALYRKYRPEVFADLIGQEHIVAALEGASNRLIDVEDWSEDDLLNLHQHYQRLAHLARTDRDTHRSLSVDTADERHRSKHHQKPGA